MMYTWKISISKQFANGDNDELYYPRIELYKKKNKCWTSFT